MNQADEQRLSDAGQLDSIAEVLGGKPTPSDAGLKMVSVRLQEIAERTRGASGPAPPTIERLREDQDPRSRPNRRGLLARIRWWFRGDDDCGLPLSY